MTTRQLLNRNSYVLVAAAALMVAGYIVAQLGTWTAWLAWILAIGALFAGFLLLRTGRGSKLSDAELELLVGSGKPVMLQLFSNY
jgi:uncharacterized membrane protein YgdD (TMEM256/DUF423 family)